MKKSILYSIITLLLFCTCRKKASIELPSSETKLVVTCFISPQDTIISAIVRQSTPKFGSAGTSSTTQFDVENAKVIISDGTKSLQLQFDADHYFYRASSKSLPILEGKTYYLNVSTPDGKNVDAMTVVPEKTFEVENLNYKITKQDSMLINYQINFEVKDIPNQTNYLAIYTQNASASSVYDSTMATQNYIDYFGFFDDDEKTSKTKYYFDNDASIMSSADTIRKAEIFLSILNANKAFYLYNKSVQQSGLSGGNPFSDPVLVYSNINNGIGCFGAYMATYIRKRIR